MLQLMQLQSHIASMKSKLILLALCALVCTDACAQIGVRYLGAKRPFYHHGDTVRVTVMMRLSPGSCLEGMKKTYLYFSGCEDILKAPWVKCPNYVFQKNLAIKLGAKADKAKITITRNTDKDSYFKQETLMIK
jgi:hypothetical protein